MIRAGSLRHKITFQVATNSRGATGEQIKTWATYRTAFAAVEPLQGREFFEAQQFQNETSVRIKTRYNSDLAQVDPRDYRISFNSKTYDIQSIINLYESSKELHFMCKLTNE